MVKAQEEGKAVIAPASNVFVTADGEQYTPTREFPEKNIIIAEKGSGSDKLYAVLEYSSKKKITEFIFERLEGLVLKDTLAFVKLKGKWGIINIKGQFVIPCRYDHIYPQTIEGKLYYFVQNEGRSGVINLSNEIVFPLEYEYFSKPGKSATLIQVAKNGKFGVMDFVTRKMAIPMIYDRMNVLNPDLVLVKKGTMSTILKLNGEKVFSNWYSELDVRYLKIVIVTLNGKKGLIDLTEKKIIPLEYDVLAEIPSMYFELSFIAGKSGKYGIIDEAGKLVLPLQYNMISKTNTDFLIATKNNKTGLLTKRGLVALPFEYEEINENGYYFKLKKDKKVGIADLTARIIIPFEYEYLKPFTYERSYRHSALIGKKNGKIGVVNFEGKPRIDFIYDSLIGFEKGTFLSELHDSYIDNIIAIKRGKYGVIDLYGREVLPFDYEEMQYVNKELVIARKNNKYGIVTIYNKDNIVLPFEYKSITFIDDVISAYKDTPEKYRVSGNRIVKESN
ncbi:hypothetical protein A4H97_04440 [Niastella yeongjuensis]|uniref:WG repeat-containing protein n=1 Tax=Niastella yeongjuensis TaxID=354355 RepID=A0A1V9EY87_9BACT|nr:hypothetical protein A4H97_04440 [Niastella yeongjuensis]